MNLTKESEYALRGLAFLALRRSPEPTSLAEVAEAQQLPITFLAKIFQKLSRHGLLDAERGRGSGYVLAADPATISVRDILEAVEGPNVLQRCLLWGNTCSEEAPCPLHFRLKSVKPRLEALLQGTTLAEYATQSPHTKLASPRASE